MKIKTALAKIAKALKQTAFYTLALIICALALAQLIQIGVYTALPTIRFIVNPYEDVLAAMPELAVIEKKVDAPVLSDEAWIANRIKEAGLNPIEAFVIISKESGYTNNENKFGINKNGTIDAGIFQINSIHYGKKYKHWQTGEEMTLTLACVVDKYCSTDWAISKRLRDGNWSAWVGSRGTGIK
jgi:hypothetical protein